jgi:pre-mRNA-splicing factor SYF2
MEDAIATRLDHFNKLKAQKLEAKKQNQKDLQHLAKQHRIASSHLGHDTQDKDSEKDISPDAIRQRHLNYTIKECEIWNEKLKTKSQNASFSTYQNFNKLAELSYKKDLSAIQVDQEEYETSRNLHGDLIGSHVPKSGDVQALVANIESANTRRTTSRSTHESTGSYVNEKNRQFNMKLNRQYDSKS